MRTSSSPANAWLLPPLKKNVTWANFSDSETRSWRSPARLTASPSVPAILAGAKGYVLKDVGDGEIARAIGVGPDAVGRLLSRLMARRVVSTASMASTPMTIQVAARRRRSGTEVIQWE